MVTNYNQQTPDAAHTTHQLVLRTVASDLKRLMPFLHPLLADQPIERISNIQLAVHELCLHIIDNNYGELGFGTIEVTATRYPLALEISVRDDAPAALVALLQTKNGQSPQKPPVFRLLHDVMDHVSQRTLEDGNLWHLRRQL